MASESSAETPKLRQEDGPSGDDAILIQSPSENDGPSPSKPTGQKAILSRRTKRLRKKQERRQQKPPAAQGNMFDLPYELMVAILLQLCPSDIFRLARVSRSIRDLVLHLGVQETVARGIISRRYPCLEKCLRLPVLLGGVDPSVRHALCSEERQKAMAIHRKPYQHIQLLDPSFVCTCLTCTLRWNSLCLVVDFAHWQLHLDSGEPIPMISRGRDPGWNQRLIDSNADVVSKALHNPLWYALILEAHLGSTVRSVDRHLKNQGNKRRHFALSVADRLSGTDAFLERNGPPTLDFPYHRDNYYMLEAYLPNRSWNGDEARWMYMPADQHDKDVELVKRFVDRNRKEGDGEELVRLQVEDRGLAEQTQESPP